MKNTLDKLIKLGVWVAITIFIIRCFLASGELTVVWKSKDYLNLIYSVISYGGEAIAVGFIFIKLFDIWIWKWKPVRKLHGIPVLAKEYKGKLSSDFDNKDRKGNLTIKQTFTGISIKFKSSESSSYSIVASLLDNYDTKQLIYTYHNDPKANIQERSPIHYGTAILYVDNVSKIEGNYYTGRGTVGYMKFTAVYDVDKKKRSL